MKALSSGNIVLMIELEPKALEGVAALSVAGEALPARPYEEL